MGRLASGIAGIVWLVAGTAQAQVPSTDIFLLPVEGTTVGHPKRVTDREGYDNQPQFLPDGSALVYSSIREGGADIYRYDLATGDTRALVTTPESEYSPTPIPGRDAISVVRDYGNLKQQLWAFPLDGGSPELLLPDVSPVGYHGWADERTVLMFVLGEPNTLQAATVGLGSTTLLGEAPGRAIMRIPGTGEMSYVDKSGDTWWVTAIDIATGDRRPLIETPDGREDLTWAPDGAAWLADDSRLYRWAPGEDDWSEVADLDAQGIYGITRVAFAPDGKTLAVVGTRPPSDLTAAYRAPAGQILGAALTDVEGWEKLTHLSTVIGHRLSGSEGLERAIEWAAERMEREGLAVRKQPVTVPHWVRGKESLVMHAPQDRELAILGLGNSVGTPPEGITAPVVVVRDWSDLEHLDRADVEGKIVLYAVEWEGYGRTVQYRGRGASRAAELGAAAALVRSATGSSLYTPHTGALRYADDLPQIPAAAVTVEDAMWMLKLAEQGIPIEVTLKMEARMLDDAQSYNVIAEIPGRERPEEVVVMGGHYDSWDVGHGAHDDGAACIAAWQALRLIHGLGLEPRRTLRVVLWTNEENGLRGGAEYKNALADDELANHVAALEMDGGCERPVGWGFGLAGVDENAVEANPTYEAALIRLQQIGRLLESIDAQEIQRGGGGADIGPLMREGVPGLGLRTVGEHYFDWHHTRADTLDKVDIQNFRKAIALLGVTAYVLADMPERLVPPAAD